MVVVPSGLYKLILSVVSKNTVVKVKEVRTEMIENVKDVVVPANTVVLVYNATLVVGLGEVVVNTSNESVAVV